MIRGPPHTPTGCAWSVTGECSTRSTLDGARITTPGRSSPAWASWDSSRDSVRRLSTFAWRSLLARRLRTVLTTAGIALGVGVLFAALATNAAVDSSVDGTVTSLFGNADLRVSAFEEVGLTDATQQAIRETPGVAAAAPQIERRAYLQIPAAGAPLRPPVTVLGID